MVNNLIKFNLKYNSLLINTYDSFFNFLFGQFRNGIVSSSKLECSDLDVHYSELIGHYIGN